MPGTAPLWFVQKGAVSAGLDWQACGALAILYFVVIEEIKRALRSTLLKYQLHREQELFDRAYDYIRQYY